MNPAVGAQPGWYPDQNSSTPLLRYWDGRQWTSDTKLPAPPEPPQPEGRRRYRSRPIKYGAIAAFVLVAVVIGIALSRGQQLCSANTAGTLTFATKGEGCISTSKQAELEANASEDKAALTANNEPGVTAGAFDGVWTSTSSGSTYRITQIGDQATVEEFTLGIGLTATGTGTIDGEVATFDFVAGNGTNGTAQYTLIDPNSLAGTISNNQLGTQQFDTLVRTGG